MEAQLRWAFDHADVAIKNVAFERLSKVTMMHPRMHHSRPALFSRIPTSCAYVPLPQMAPLHAHFRFPEHVTVQGHFHDTDTFAVLESMVRLAGLGGASFSALMT